MCIRDRVPLFQKGIVPAATVARVGNAVLKDRALFPQPPLYPFDDVRQLLVVLPVGMVRFDIRYHMVRGVDAQLREIVKLPGLARLYAYSDIGVRRAVMSFVGDIF